MDINRALDRLDKVRQVGPDKWVACCPAHTDETPSLTIKNTSDRILVHCFGGCTPSQVVSAMGLELRDLFIESKAPRQIAPGISRRKLADALEIELLILAQLAHKRAHSEEISDVDGERERIAWQRVDAARRLSQ